MAEKLVDKVGESLFIIALPKELPKEVGHVEGYEGVPKVGLIIGTTNLGAVSSYLHREGICNAPKLVIDKLNKMGSERQDAGRYSLNISDIKSEGASEGPYDREIAIEVLAADFLAKRHGGVGMYYLEEVRGLIREFEATRI